MAKKVTGIIRLQVPAGAANLAPPMVPRWCAGVNIMQFCKEFNAKTADAAGLIIPVVITVYATAASPSSEEPARRCLLKRAAGLAKGSGVPNRDKVGKVTRDQVREIAKTKQADLNAVDEEAAMRIVEGTARSMGIDIE